MKHEEQQVYQSELIALSVDMTKKEYQLHENLRKNIDSQYFLFSTNKKKRISIIREYLRKVVSV